MTVHEIEDITGLTRANIRFYEAQGLIAPARQENRYRVYTDEHAQVLLRIKLLRALGMSLEQIRALQTGQDNMIAALDRQIALLEAQQIQLGNSQRVCREMRADDVRYDTLDASRYLNSLENPPRKPSQIVAEDVVPPVFAPWQRFWARMFDGFFYSMVLFTVSAWLLDGRITEWSGTVSTILGFAMTLVFEPLLLWAFGTTLGKWIFGIRVTDNWGNRLSLSDGFGRTVTVIIYGEGVGIPLIQLWRYWRSYQMYQNREYLAWEDRSETIVKDTNPFRYLAAVAAALAIFGAAIGLTALMQMPHNRGQLTVAQFCENYRKLAAQDGMDMERFVLQDDGTWTENRNTNTFYIDMTANASPLDMVFTTENGYVTSVTISEELIGEQDGWVGGRNSQMRLMTLSLLMAQPEYNIFRGDEKALNEWLNGMNYQDITFTTCGIQVTYDAALSGYWTADAMLFEDDDPDTESYYAMTFTVETVG